MGQGYAPARKVVRRMELTEAATQEAMAVERMPAPGADATAEPAGTGEPREDTVPADGGAAQDPAGDVMAGWVREQQTLRELYPAFDLRAECLAPGTGERFQDLLRAGLDLRTAYEAVHRDAILRGAMQYAARRIRDGYLKRNGADAARPRENGTGGQGAAGMARPDVHGMTRAEREAIARRVLHGERIEL